MLVVALLLGPLGQRSLLSDPVEVGYRDFSFGTAPTTPTADKPQSKLWFNDGSWWAPLFTPGSPAFRIHRLDVGTQTWVNTGTVVETRAGARMDVLWDAAFQKLYVVSGSSSLPALLYRFSYAAGAYSLDQGFPVTVRSSGAESITLTKDSNGRLWVAYQKAGVVQVNRSLTSDTDWGATFTPPVEGTSNGSDDIAAVTALPGRRIGVMWSNQVARRFYFAIHHDDDPDNVWQPVEVALPGPGQDPALAWADDHINLAVGPNGFLYAAVKTSINDASGDPAAPVVMLLVRDLAGNWSSHVVSRIADDQTRPIIQIDAEHRIIYVFGTGPEAGGAIYYKAAPLDNVAFVPGVGNYFIRSSQDTRINNATGTKQLLSSQTGLLVLAADHTTTDTYLHNYLSLSEAPPVARTLTLTPVADTYVDAANPSRNHGTLTTVRLDSSPLMEAYFKFNLSSISGRVVSAKLRINNRNGGDVGGAVAPMTNASWSETGVTYNNRPAIDGPVLASLGAVVDAQWYELDVTGAITGAGLLSLGLRTSSSDQVAYGSREGSFAPQLVITLSDEAPMPPPPSLAATTVSDTQIGVTWSYGDATGFEIERATAGAPFQVVAGVGSSARSYSDTPLQPGTQYFYRARASTISGTSVYSAIVSATTTNNAPQSLTFISVADTYVDSASPNQNFGAATRVGLDTSPVVESYLKFQVSGITGTVQSAKLRLNVANASDKGGTVAAMTDSGWTEAGVTYNNRPAIDGPGLATLGAVTAGQWVEMDVTPAVTANGTISLGLKAASNDRADYYSRNYKGREPQLIVTVSPSVSPTAAPGNVTATTASDTQIDLAWTYSGDATSFQIERATSGSAFQLVAGLGGSARSYFDTLLQPGTTYFYRARTTTPSTTSAYSATVSATTTNNAPQSLTFTPSADAYVDSANPGTNYGAITRLNLDTSPVLESYLKFQVSGVSGTIQSAKLRLFVANASDLGGGVATVSDSSWTEAGVTYITRPAIDGPVLAALGPVTAGQWVELDVTSAVTANGTISLGLKPASNDRADYYSREYKGREPQLVVTYQP